jgi:hypothetical protein
MPVSGDINEEFGIYTSVCCRTEIVISAGSRFPNCPKHPKPPTEWKSTTDEPQVNQLPNKKSGDSAA